MYNVHVFSKKLHFSFQILVHCVLLTEQQEIWFLENWSFGLFSFVSCSCSSFVRRLSCFAYQICFLFMPWKSTSEEGVLYYLSYIPH